MSSKKSKTAADGTALMHGTAQSPAEVSDAAAKLSDIPEDQVTGSCAGHAALPKENRSPNVTLLDHLEAELDAYTDSDQVLAAALRHSSYSKQHALSVQDMTSVNFHSLLLILLQAKTGQETSAAPSSSSEGLLNLLLLADSSLQDCDNDPSNDMPNQPEAVSEQVTGGAMHDGTEDVAAASMSLHPAGHLHSTSDASQQRPMSAGILTANFLQLQTVHNCFCKSLVPFAHALSSCIKADCITGKIVSDQPECSLALCNHACWAGKIMSCRPEA